MSLQPSAVELLEALAPVLTRWGRWYLFGAQAVTAHGAPRLSADVDVTLALAQHSRQPFINEMTAAGFSLRVSDPDFVAVTSVLLFVHDKTAMPLDVVFAGSGLEEEFLSRRVVLDFGGTQVPTIDVGDLIVAKVLAGRPQDTVDAAALWKRHKNAIDTNRIRLLLEQLEVALGQSDLLSTFAKFAR